MISNHKIRIRKLTTKNFDKEEICADETKFQFTHDKIPVRKILVVNISPLTTQKGLKKIFAPYGEIIDCNLKRKSDKNSYAFITFKESESAQKAIIHRYISIDEQNLRVLPAAAWHQPDRNNCINNVPVELTDIEANRLSAYNQYSLNDESPILKLNEYCLMHIFKFLPVRDVIRIQRVCRYWQIISIESLHFHKKFNSILRYDNLKYIKNASTLYNVLEKFGSYITKVNDLITLNKFNSLGDNSTLIAIAKLCPNIEEINLIDFPFLASGIRALAENCSKIKRIDIGKKLYRSNKLFDKELSALFLKNRNIEYLGLYGQITDGSCLKHLSTKYIRHLCLFYVRCFLFTRVISKIKNLVTLEVHNCNDAHKLFQVQDLTFTDSIEELVIEKFFSVELSFLYPNISNNSKSNNFKNLKRLSAINGVLTDEVLFILGENFNQLTYLDVSNNRNITNLGLICIIKSLSKLEHLNIQSCDVTNEIFCCGMPNLKTLSCKFCYSIGDEGLIKLINNSDKLELLDVSYCRSVTKKLIFAAAEYTKRKNNKIVLSIKAEETRIHKNDLEDLEETPFLEFTCNGRASSSEATISTYRHI